MLLTAALAVCDTNLFVHMDTQLFLESVSVYFSFVTSDLFWEGCAQVALVIGRVKITEQRSNFIDFRVTFLGIVFFNQQRNLGKTFTLILISL